MLTSYLWVVSPAPFSHFTTGLLAVYLLDPVCGWSSLSKPQLHFRIYILSL